MTLAKIIPLSFVMIAGPQILSAIFLATSEDWRGNSAALVAGAAVSITAIVTLAFFLSDGASKQGASGHALDIIFMVLLIAAGVHTFLTRKTSKPPKWMGKLEENIYKKLGATTRAEAVTLADSIGLLPPSVTDGQPPSFTLS